MIPEPAVASVWATIGTEQAIASQNATPDSPVNLGRRFFLVFGWMLGNRKELQPLLPSRGLHTYPFFTKSRHLVSPEGREDDRLKNCRAREILAEELHEARAVFRIRILL